MKSIRPLLLVFTVVTSFLLASCVSEISYDEGLLIGKWSRTYTEDNQTKVEYYRYDSGGKGVTWVPAEDVTEAEGQAFSWILDQSDLTHIYVLEVSSTPVTKIYTVTKLTSTTLEYKDDFGVLYSFTKVTTKQ